jgi:hypothetical protein
MKGMERKYSFEEILSLGEKIYFEKYDELRPYEGQHVVIDVGTGKYAVDEDRFKALQKAEQLCGKKLFFFARIGNLRQQINSKKSDYAWKF